MPELDRGTARDRRPVELYERLREEIVSGRLPAGGSLVETALASRYGTSRTPVREALRRLEQDGLVEKGDRGMQVRSRSPEEILEIYEVRIELEGSAAWHAAERHTPLDLVRLEHSAEQMREATTAGEEAMARSNRLFHEAVWVASHNATLVDLLIRLHSHLTRYPATTLTSPGRWETVLAEHEQLIEFITRRDAPEARALAEQHMTRARDIRLQMYGANVGR
jgi:DNA-binding GntR family transcriptional regulator